MEIKDIRINDEIFHPCSIDIIKYKVIGIKQFENFNHYFLKSINDVGACGKIEVIVDQHNNKLRFIKLINEENIEHSSGLQDFIEGFYYRTLNEARLEFYKQQETLAWSNFTQKERLFNEAKDRYEQIKLLVKSIKKDLYVKDK